MNLDFFSTVLAMSGRGDKKNIHREKVNYLDKLEAIKTVLLQEYSLFVNEIC